MSILESIFYFLAKPMARPIAFGWFHLTFWGILIMTTIFMCLYFRNADDKKVRTILLFYSSVCLILEVYKQLIFSLHYNNRNIVWNYDWYSFPFQFCSTFMYISLTVGLIKNGRLRNALMTYLATFVILAGILVMLYPSSCFTSLIGINVQTMMYHSSQIVVGVYLLVTKKIKLNYKAGLDGIYVFLVCVGVALTLNIVVYHLGITDSFNMFYISPYYKSSMLVYSYFWDNLPYPLFLALYIVPFSVVSYLIFVIRCYLSVKKEKIYTNPINQQESSHSSFNYSIR